MARKLTLGFRQREMLEFLEKYAEDNVVTDCPILDIAKCLGMLDKQGMPDHSRVSKILRSLVAWGVLVKLRRVGQHGVARWRILVPSAALPQPTRKGMKKQLFTPLQRKILMELLRMSDAAKNCVLSINLTDLTETIGNVDEWDLPRTSGTRTAMLRLSKHGLVERLEKGNSRSSLSKWRINTGDIESILDDYEA